MAQYKTGTVSVTNGSATVTGSGTLFSANVAAGDLFTIVGDNAWYEVASSAVIFENDTIGVDLELRETNADIYYWATSEESAYDASPNTNLPNPFNVGSATNFAWTQDKFYVTGLGSLSWTAPTDSFVAYYKLRIVYDAYVSGNKTDAQIAQIDRETTVYGTSFTITDLPSGYYTAYLTSVNQMGVRYRDWETKESEIGRAHV